MSSPSEDQDVFHPATRLVVIAGHYLNDRICSIIEAGGGTGYTQFPVGGKGRHHRYPGPDQASVADGFDQIRTEVICASREKAEAMARRILSECFQEFPGVMFLEEVQVCRPSRF